MIPKTAPSINPSDTLLTPPPPNAKANPDKNENNIGIQILLARNEVANMINIKAIDKDMRMKFIE